MTRYRGGTYSHTVDTIVFADGSSAWTDLIRLNPNIQAYSLDFAGVAPTRPSRYSADTWSAVPHLRTRAHEPEVDWIIRNSYPTVPTAALSERLRAAGYPLGARNIAEHEAIAGTQAAIWRLTNGLELDTRALSVPSRVTEQAGAVVVAFDDECQLAGYTAHVATSTGAVLRLQKSADGQQWENVAASAVAAPRGGGWVAKRLGLGSTLCHSRYARRCGGYRHYRLVADGEATVSDIEFGLHGAPRYRNAEAVVHLYDYLLAGAGTARAAAVTPWLRHPDAGVDGDTVGPFTLVAADVAAFSVAGARVVRGDGVAITEPLRPGAEFFLRTRACDVTLSIKVPGHEQGYGGRVITGVARDENDGTYTPLALAVPTQVVVEFDISVRG